MQFACANKEALPFCVTPCRMQVLFDTLLIVSAIGPACEVDHTPFILEATLS